MYWALKRIGFWIVFFVATLCMLRGWRIPDARNVDWIKWGYRFGVMVMTFAACVGTMADDDISAYINFICSFIILVAMSLFFEIRFGR